MSYKQNVFWAVLQFVGDAVDHRLEISFPTTYKYEQRRLLLLQCVRKTACQNKDFVPQ